VDITTFSRLYNYIHGHCGYEINPFWELRTDNGVKLIQVENKFKNINKNVREMGQPGLRPLTHNGKAWRVKEILKQSSFATSALHLPNPIILLKNDKFKLKQLSISRISCNSSEIFIFVPSENAVVFEWSK
jgi:hypothetical protein